jgi:hypothetical protein
MSGMKLFFALFFAGARGDPGMRWSHALFKTVTEGQDG